MPIYNDLPVLPFYFSTSAEEFIRTIHGPMDIKSILDVGAGHGGVFDYGYWTNKPMERRAACDIFHVRPMEGVWEVHIGVDAMKLSEHFPEKSFDYIQCMETLEHVDDPRKALEEMCKVARKLVIITSADEEHHRGPAQEAIEKWNEHLKFKCQPKVKDMLDLGFKVGVDNYNQRQLIAWKTL